MSYPPEILDTIHGALSVLPAWAEELAIDASLGRLLKALVLNLSDEKFAELRGVIGQDAWDALQALRIGEVACHDPECPHDQNSQSPGCSRPRHSHSPKEA